MKNNKINQEIKETIIARIDAQPSNLRLSIGSSGSLTKEEMIEHVKKEDEIGKQIIRVHLNFLKAIANGEFVKAVNSVE